MRNVNGVSVSQCFQNAKNVTKVNEEEGTFQRGLSSFYRDDDLFMFRKWQKLDALISLV